MILDSLQQSDRLAILVVFGLALLPAILLDTFLLSFLMLLVMYAALSIGWNILGGYAGYQSFGHVAFLGIGGYTSVWLFVDYGIEPYLTAPLGALIAGVVALLVGYPCLRLKGPYFALVTLIVALAVEVVVSNLPGLNATSGIFLKPPLDSTLLSQAFLYELMVVVLAITIIVARYVERSKYGLGLYAIREDEEVASTQGINRTKLKLGAFVVSAGLAGLAGGIYAWFLGYVTPAPMFDVRISILVVLIALLGGTQSWVGPFMGAILLRVVDQVLVLQFGGQVAQIMYGLLLAVVILFLPQGIYPHARKLAQDRLPPRLRTLSFGGDTS